MFFRDWKSVLRDLGGLECMVGGGWVRACSGEVVPCPPYSPAPQHPSIMAEWRQPPVLPNPAPQWQSNRKFQWGGGVFKKADHKARMLFFNPTFILELYMPGTQDLLDSCVCSSTSFLPFSLSSSNILFTEDNVK